MKIRPNIGPDCFAAANIASREKLTADEINAAFQRVFDYKESLRRSGDITDMAEKLRTFAEKEAERTKIAAALLRRQAGLNILIRDRVDQAIDSFMDAGLKPVASILALLEGTSKAVDGGRNSVAALNLAYEGKYLGGMFAEIQANKPHLLDAMRDPKMDADIMREMAELKEGGKPGITGNKDAQYAAKVFASYAELSRTDLNRLGASIGKLDGWSGSQVHDDVKMIAAGKDAWITAILPKLDVARTFPEASSAKDIEEAMSGIYDTIISGLPNKPTPREMGQRVNPANLAKSLGKSRVLHFRDADSDMAYRAEFGYGNTVSGMVSHLRNASRLAANMEALGPNPEVMLGSVVDGLKRKIKDDPKMTPAAKDKALKGLEIDGGAIRQAIDIATGLSSRPVNVTAAKISSDIRAAQSMAKLGGAVFSSFSDTITAGAASQFRGSGFFKGFVNQLDGLRIGRSNKELNEIAFLLGEGFDGIQGHIVSPAAAVDGPVGVMSWLQEKFFRWNGLSWWTDVQRASAARMIASEMGMRAKTGFDQLPAAYRNVLGLHGIDAPKWEVIRKAQFREVNGATYVTPDRIRDLPDEAFEGMGDVAKARNDLEMAVRRFVADETSYGVIETDPRSRRTMTLGLRPGTVAGEAIRFIGQFKGFPIAFTQRVGGRAAFGFKPEARASQVGHIATLLAGLTMAGYASMTVKDLLKGYWPPRDPTDPKTIGAAFVQGGAAGIYGDFLFGRVNRFGGGLTETAIGPAPGALADLGELMLKARDAGLSADEEVKFADLFNATWNNIPYVNLFYVRPAIDYLFLNSMREAVSPGYMKRQESRRKTDYGQTKAEFLPDSLRPLN